MFEIFQLFEMPVTRWQIPVLIHAHIAGQSVEVSVKPRWFHSVGLRNARVVGYLVREPGKADLLLRVAGRYAA